MEGFRQNPKMKSQIACFKEGGSTTPAKKEAKRHEKADVAEDKKIAKKAVSQHEAAKHKGEEKTELKLKEGGRSKKDKPSVKRYDSKAIKMKKDDSDKKAIAKVKKTKPVVERMSPAPAAPAPQGMGMPMEDTSDANMGVQSFAYGVMPADIPAPGLMAPYMPQQRRRMMPPGVGAGLGALGGMGAGLGAMGGMGAGMGAAGALDPQAVMQGLQAVGSYCAGGKA